MTDPTTYGPPEPTGVVIEVPDGLLHHSLPLPAGQPPEAWIEALVDALGTEWAVSARWSLVAARPRSDTPIQALGWRPVATAGSP